MVKLAPRLKAIAASQWLTMDIHLVKNEINMIASLVNILFQKFRFILKALSAVIKMLPTRLLLNWKHLNVTSRLCRRRPAGTLHQ